MTYGQIPYLVEGETREKDVFSRVKRHAQTINQILRGRLNCYGTVTLTAGAATTVVNDPSANSNRVLLLEPTTANAAAELGNGTCYRSATTNGVSFTLAHANNGQADRTFNYVLIG